MGGCSGWLFAPGNARSCDLVFSGFAVAASFLVHMLVEFGSHLFTCALAGFVVLIDFDF